MKAITVLLACWILGSTSILSAAEEVRIRQSQKMMTGQQLGSRSYIPLEDEGHFLDKVTEKQINFQTRSLSLKPAGISDANWKAMEKERLEKEKKMVSAQQYQLFLQTGEYAGWMGIVRSMDYDAATDKTRLRIEHKYFDGITDLNLQVVSIYGAGDFSLTLPGRVTPEQIPLLSLIRAYGKVSKESNGLPGIQAEYVRVWNWGLFTFVDYGRDKSNPAWVKFRQFQGEDVYSGNPTTKFYEDRLGKRETSVSPPPGNGPVPATEPTPASGPVP